MHPLVLPISDLSFLQRHSYPHSHNKSKKWAVLLTAGSRESAAYVSFFTSLEFCCFIAWSKKSDKIKREDDNVSRRVKQGQRIIWQSHHLIRSDGCSGKKITPVACEVFVALADGALRNGNFSLNCQPGRSRPLAVLRESLIRRFYSIYIFWLSCPEGYIYLQAILYCHRLYGLYMVLARITGPVKLIHLAEYLPYWRSCAPSKLNQHVFTEFRIRSVVGPMFSGICNKNSSQPFNFYHERSFGMCIILPF
jgi:hypothetical protein